MPVEDRARSSKILRKSLYASLSQTSKKSSRLIFPKDVWGATYRPFRKVLGMSPSFGRRRYMQGATEPSSLGEIIQVLEDYFVCPQSVKQMLSQ
jgi:hypothetical protein